MTTETPKETAFATWQPAQCPFLIEYSVDVLEGIRASVTEAFYCLPRGGMETGGVLYGTLEDGRVRIAAYRPLACEHALGPSFTLSNTDHLGLEELLQAPAKDNELDGLVPVGWYHSHTRSGLALSDKDIEIHDRYFPNPLQVALLVRPESFRPMRAGFFFRQGDGSIQGARSLQEFEVGAAAPARTAAAATQLSQDRPDRVQPDPPEQTATTVDPLAGPSESQPETPANVHIIPASAFGISAKAGWERQYEPPRRLKGWWPKVAALVVLALAAAGYLSRDLWLPLLEGSKAEPVELTVVDTNEQLLVRWDRFAKPVRRALDGDLEIVEGKRSNLIHLDQRTLHLGSFTYSRSSEKVDLSIALRQPNGDIVREYTSFLGPPPKREPTPEELEAKRRQEAAAEQIRSELAAQAQKTRRLERTLQDLRQQISSEGESSGTIPPAEPTARRRQE